MGKDDFSLSKVVGRGQLPGDEVAIERVSAAFAAHAADPSAPPAQEGSTTAKTEARRRALADGLELILIGRGCPFLQYESYLDAADALIVKMDAATRRAD